jgi:hypothetical protein
MAERAGQQELWLCHHPDVGGRGRGGLFVTATCTLQSPSEAISLRFGDLGLYLAPGI